MLLVHLPLASDTGLAGTESEAALLQDAIWVHAGPQHSLEHIRVRPVEHGMNVALFVRADNLADARVKARSLLSHVIGARAARGYRLADSRQG
ncbi:hypothetical protein MTF65_10190 [Streptomyces sp. APSN-46.1]|uniref:hypothetical protein n=1 Tax=Streptomyces sp. APSN-46.1 TaxID=2929049 RepID=UPI001FB1D13D|nr:hypothetical protein [Streptomyces sp. APSN-46.1]MCJ1677701.1 hypothetical protein [Streptomyces sp. APSN-46.1]